MRAEEEQNQQLLIPILAILVYTSLLSFFDLFDVVPWTLEIGASMCQMRFSGEHVILQPYPYRLPLITC